MPHRILPPPFSHSADDIPKINLSAKRLKIDILTIPAFGHFQTTSGIAAALYSRGHNVTFVLCDRSRSDFNRFNNERSISFRSAGPCIKYEERGKILAELIADDSSASSLSSMLNAVSDLSFEMCSVLMNTYEELQLNDELPDVIVFDADSYCAMDLSIRFGIPRVARVGTGLRDAYTNPIYTPIYSSGNRVVELTAPFIERLSSRLKNAALLFLSRYLIAPFLLPNVYARYRHHWLIEKSDTVKSDDIVNKNGKTYRTSDTLQKRLTSINGSPVYALEIDEVNFRANLPWDGVPTLYNSHWGLEHPRPIQPYEHLIGHTNEFARDAKETLSIHIENWMNADTNVPVVYVGLGTLSVLPKSLIEKLSIAFTTSTQARFIWAGIQDTSLFSKDIVDKSNRARCACRDVNLHNKENNDYNDDIILINNMCDNLFKNDKKDHSLRLTSCASTAHSGRLLLTGWVPQVPLLLHNNTKVFITHGGMNGIAEGLFARLPLYCLPLFSDQPDNCAHAQDKGFALSARQWRSETPISIQESLARLLSNDSRDTFISASQTAWVANIGAGGMFRAVELVEQSAALPYGSHLYMIPRIHFLPWYEAMNIDMWGVTVLVITILVFLCSRMCHCLKNCCCCCLCQEKKVKKE